MSLLSVFSSKPQKATPESIRKTYQGFYKVKQDWLNLIKENSPEDIVALTPAVCDQANVIEPKHFSKEVIEKLEKRHVGLQGHRNIGAVTLRALGRFSVFSVTSDPSVNKTTRFLYTAHEFVHAFQTKHLLPSLLTPGYFVKMLRGLIFSLPIIKKLNSSKQETYKTLHDLSNLVHTKTQEFLKEHRGISSSSLKTLILYIDQRSDQLYTALIKELEQPRNKLKNIPDKLLRIMKQHYLSEIQANMLTKNHILLKQFQSAEIKNDLNRMNELMPLYENDVTLQAMNRALYFIYSSEQRRRRESLQGHS